MGVDHRGGQRWVQVLDYRVIKHQNPKDYAHEKNISMLLSHYPHFVTLLSHDDDCRLLTFERLFTMKKQQLNLTHAKPQLDLMFDTLTNEGLFPSYEFYYGLCCNLWVGDRQNLTMFDFHQYGRWTDIAKKGKAKIPALTKADPILVARSLDEYNKGILANLWKKLVSQHEVNHLNARIAELEGLLERAEGKLLRINGVVAAQASSGAPDGSQSESE